MANELQPTPVVTVSRRDLSTFALLKPTAMPRNELFPIFLKTDKISALIVGGGAVAAEKLHFLLKSSPRSVVSVVSPVFCEEILAMRAAYPQLELLEAAYGARHLAGRRLAIAATDNEQVNRQVYADCRERGILVNVADQPLLCDFYMGSIVSKGALKLGISTDGKSPVLAKRLRQFFEEFLPEDVDRLINNMEAYRETLKGDFHEKLERLNKHTEGLLKK